jgi:hypothetical protein
MAISRVCPETGGSVENWRGGSSGTTKPGNGVIHVVVVFDSRPPLAVGAAAI